MTMGLEGRRRWTEANLAPYLGTYTIRARWPNSEDWIITGSVTLFLPRNEAEWERPWLGMFARWSSGREGYFHPQAVRHHLAAGSLVRAA